MVARGFNTMEADKLREWLSYKGPGAIASVSRRPFINYTRHAHEIRSSDGGAPAPAAPSTPDRAMGNPII